MPKHDRVIITLTPDQNAIVQQLLDSGVVKNRQALGQAALAVFAETEGLTYPETPGKQVEEESDGC